MSKQVTILTGDPTVTVLAEMQLDWGGLNDMAEWVRAHRPECLPDDYDVDGEDTLEDRAMTLFPHPLAEDNRVLTHNELLVELAGRKCYDSFGLKAGKRTNREYIANTQMHMDPAVRAKQVSYKVEHILSRGAGRTAEDADESPQIQAQDEIAATIREAQNTVPHASITYHAKMSFFIAGVSRRVSHELIRNYVGADRDEEGNPSQESTRYTEHYGFYIAHPKILGESKADWEERVTFTEEMQHNYDAYLAYVRRQTARATVDGKKLSTIEKKRILESASPYLSHSCETSWVWTTNPGALAKMFKERDNDGADLEFRRLARAWKRVCMARWPNLFPQPWMQDARS